MVSDFFFFMAQVFFVQALPTKLIVIFLIADSLVLLARLIIWTRWI